MKAPAPEVLTHAWMVSGTIPSPDQKHPHYGQNVRVGVQAESLEKAIEQVTAIYTGIKLFSINHLSEINIIQP